MREQEMITSFKHVGLLKGCDNLLLLPADVDNQRH